MSLLEGVGMLSPILLELRWVMALELGFGMTFSVGIVL